VQTLEDKRSRIPPSCSQARKALETHFKELRQLQLRDPFADGPKQGERFTAGRLHAQRMIPEIESEAEPTLNHDSSTNALIRHYGKYKETQ